MASQFFSGLFSQKTSQACLIDITPPTFAGVQSITPNNDGSFTVAWNIATDLSGPIKYNIYVALGVVSAAALFVSQNISKVVKGVLNSRIITLGDQSTYFINGQVYTIGVRAEDGVGQIETNSVLISSTAIGSGNLSSVFQTIAASLVVTDANLQNDHVNFQADNAEFIDRINELIAINTALATRNSELVALNLALSNRNAEFIVDHANFLDDHANFENDHTNLQADHVNFQTDHTNFLADHANFQTDHANFQGDRNFISDITGTIDSDPEITIKLEESEVIVITVEEDTN